jgi:hypothetical protein
MFYAWSGHFGPFNKLRDEMNRLFDTAFLGRGFIPNLFERRTFPRLNMRETENALVVECELPGGRPRRAARPTITSGASGASDRSSVGWSFPHGWTSTR